jgi:hypothetical protein
VSINKFVISALFIFVSLLYQHCNYEEKSITVKQDITSQRQKHSPLDSIFSAHVKLELRSFISKLDSLNGFGNLKRIIVIYFEEIDGKCNMFFSSSMYYDNYYTQGFTIVDDILIVVYKPEIRCNSKQINLSFLSVGNATGFPDEKSNEAKFGTFEPILARYEVLGFDSLRFVRYYY